VYDPCFYRDINYEHLLDNDSIIEELFHRNTEKDQIKTCTSWQFNTSEFGDTITSEVITIIFLSISYKKKLRLYLITSNCGDLQWNLVCGRKQLKNFAEMMFLMGVAFGGFFSGLVSDR